MVGLCRERGLGAEGRNLALVAISMKKCSGECQLGSKHYPASTLRIHCGWRLDGSRE